MVHCTTVAYKLRKQQNNLTFYIGHRIGKKPWVCNSAASFSNGRGYMQVSSTLLSSCRLQKPGSPVTICSWFGTSIISGSYLRDYDYDLVRHTCGMGSKKAVQNISKNHNLLFLHTNITPDFPSSPCCWLGFRMFQVGQWWHLTTTVSKVIVRMSSQNQSLVSNHHKNTEGIF